ncbi:MAG: hypothetical protein QW568_00955 [Candidatus Anstonellaceae archaeon]
MSLRDAPKDGTKPLYATALPGDGEPKHVRGSQGRKINHPSAFVEQKEKAATAKALNAEVLNDRRKTKALVDAINEASPHLKGEYGLDSKELLKLATAIKKLSASELADAGSLQALCTSLSILELAFARGEADSVLLGIYEKDAKDIVLEIRPLWRMLRDNAAGITAGVLGRQLYVASMQTKYLPHEEKSLTAQAEESGRIPKPEIERHRLLEQSLGSLAELVERFNLPPLC